MSDGLVTFWRARLAEKEAEQRVKDLMATADGLDGEREASTQGLREVEADRKAMERHVPVRRHRSRHLTCRFDNHLWPCADVLDRIAVWAGHPDFPGSPTHTD